MKNNKFKEFYFKQKQEKVFENVFEKWYSLGYWGSIDKDKIKNQQHSWYQRLIKLIKEKDYHSLLLSVENRDNKVTREMFSKLTNIDIKKKKIEYIKEKLRDFCLKEIKNTISKSEENERTNDQ